MILPDKAAAKALLEEHVQDEYQRFHALMVATGMEGYATLYDADPQLWYLAGYLHDLDYEKHPDAHPAPSLAWFKDWGYPEDFIHAVEAHAYGYNGFTTLPQTPLAAALMACDEISGIFYAYRKLNPIPYSEIKNKSIRKRLKEKSFAAKINREDILRGCEALGISIEDHVGNLIRFYEVLK